MIYCKCSQFYTAKPIQILMGNFCINILSFPSIYQSVTLSKLNWGGIPIKMTCLVPGDSQCILPRCVHLTSTCWLSQLSPHVCECCHQDDFCSKRSWLFCHSHASPSPKCAKWQISLTTFVLTTDPHSHTSLWHVKGHFYRSADPLYTPFEICFTSVFATLFLQNLILI